MCFKAVLKKVVEIFFWKGEWPKSYTKCGHKEIESGFRDENCFTKCLHIETSRVGDELFEEKKKKVLKSEAHLITSLPVVACIMPVMNQFAMKSLHYTFLLVYS